MQHGVRPGVDFMINSLIKHQRDLAIMIYMQL